MENRIKQIQEAVKWSKQMFSDEYLTNKRKEKIHEYYLNSKTYRIDYQKQAIERMSDNYIKVLIHDETTIPYDEIPQTLIEAYREQLRIKRLLTKINQP